MKRQVAAQKRQMLAAPQGNGVEVVAIGHRGANDEQQDLRQRVGDAPRLARIVNDRKVVKQRPKTRFFRKSIKDKAHGGGSRIAPPKGITLMAIR